MLFAQYIPPLYKPLSYFYVSHRLYHVPTSQSSTLAIFLSLSLSMFLYNMIGSVSDMVNLGEKLRKLRLDKGLTQVEMSKRLGISPIMISSYELEKRSPGFDVLIKLSAFFGVTTDYLLGIEKQRTVNVHGLNDNEIEIINNMAEALRNKSKTSNIC